MDSLAGKSDRIRNAVSQLRRRFGHRAFAVIDYWPDDQEIIGIARPDEDNPCVCIFTDGKDEGRFDVEQSGTVYHDCLIQGLTWVVGEELDRPA